MSERFEVDIHRITFKSSGEPLVGDLYLPTMVEAVLRPGIVVTGAWMTVRQQQPATYAHELARRGFVALTFDFRNWGESGGVRRQFEDPHAKAADIKAAIMFLANRPEVDPARVGGLGVCVSSGYMIEAARETPTMRSVAVVAPWFHDRPILDQIYGGAGSVDALLAKGDLAEAEYRRTGKQTLVPAASNTDKRAVMFQFPYYTEFDRGMIPEWRNEADLAFWRGWLTNDTIAMAAGLKQPFLMIESDAAAVPEGAHAFYARVRSPKRELWLENITQFDFYDQPVPVGAAIDAAVDHFSETLATGRPEAEASAATVGSGQPTPADRAAIAETVGLIGLHADQHEWEAIKTCFAPEVTVDYTALFGGEPQTQPSADVVASWRAMLPGFDATQHMITVIEVQLSDCDHATVRSNVRATHRLDKALWVVGGLYTHELERAAAGWQVRAMRLSLAYEEGDRNLVAKAGERAKLRSR